MTDRAIELAAAIMLCSTDAIAYSVACERLLTKWEGEDMERAEKAAKHLPEPPGYRSFRDDIDKRDLNLTTRLSTALEQLGIVSARLGATQQALKDCLSQMGYANLTNYELEWERKQGNEQVAAIQRARAVLADHANAKVAETLKPDEPDRPRCETCRFWDNSASLDHKENTGMCRAALPERDKRTGAAVWPFSEDTDSCASHIPCQIPDDTPY